MTLLVALLFVAAFAALTAAEALLRARHRSPLVARLATLASATALVLFIALLMRSS